MFEHRQELMRELMQENAEFRSLYNRHCRIDDRIKSDSEGELLLDDLELQRLKKERLYLKDCMYRIMNESEQEAI